MKEFLLDTYLNTPTGDECAKEIVPVLLKGRLNFRIKQNTQRNSTSIFVTCVDDVSFQQVQRMCHAKISGLLSRGLHHGS